MFSARYSYGSPVNTPNIDQLAQNGLLYTTMHTPRSAHRRAPAS